ncbi:MAG: glycosyltransferase family 4 protein [Acidobacteria bacterium]|nr:glycosyltransferase family 4 protein [Acidobacteriota bacterium]
MIRVLFLTESFHPVLGGGEQHIRTLATRLSASGMPCSVLTRRTDAAWPDEEVLDGVPVRRVPPSGAGRGGKYAMVPHAVRALVEERGSCDVLVVRGTRVLGLPGLLAGRALGLPLVLQAELNGEMSGEVYTWGTSLDGRAGRTVVRGAVAVRNLLLRDADAFVAMSRRIREEFVASGVPEERVAYVPHGVDTTRFRPASPEERRAVRRRLGWPETGEIVTYTGRLLRGKGLETLVDAFAAVAARRPRARLVLVGSGAGQVLSVEDELRERVRQAGLGGVVVFTGRVDAVEDCLRGSDVFAFPSVFEALGISLVEAAACGLACVGSRTGGIVDVIEEGRSGLLVAPGDTAGLSGALEALLSDEARRAALGERGRAVALGRFDFADSVERYRCLFLEVTSRRSGACSRARAARGGAAPRR